MAQIREIKKRIKSVENTKKVTHAMELVAAAKMRKSQAIALAGRPYSISLHEVMAEVKNKSKSAKHPLLMENEAEKQMIILISSDRGLAGGLNINLFREISRLLGHQDIRTSGNSKSDPTTRQPSNQKTLFVTIGKKATEFSAKTNQNLVASYNSEEKSAFDMARILAKMAIEAFTKGEVSKVSILYPHFDSVAKQTPKWISLLPIEIDLEPNNLRTQHPNDLIFEPTSDEILESILPHHILTQIYQVLVEAKASEFSARMVAMKNATDAASDLVDDLSLTYNQARQESITKELLDIVTAQKGLE